MVDFDRFLKAGIESANILKANREEIDDVFNNVNESLQRISPNLTFQKESRQKSKFGKSILDMTFTNYTALVLKNSLGENYEIAVWTQDDTGYPCTIEYGHIKLRCDGRVSLEEAFGELLSQGSTGEVIQKLLNGN